MTEFLLKDKSDLHLCNMCGPSYHSLEDFPKIIEKVLNKMSINLLQTIMKNEIMNTKNVHVVTTSSTGKNSNNQYHQVICPIENTMK